MFTHKHYVPILKGKAGEFGALRELSVTARGNLTPLIEITPMDEDDTIDDHLDGLVEKLLSCWIDLTRPIFIDFVNIDDSIRMSNGDHFLKYFFDEARQKGLKAIPVTNFDHDANFQNEVRSIQQLDQLGICMRLDSDDFGSFNFTNHIQAALTSLSVNANETDLIIDFRDVMNSQRQIMQYAVVNLINGLPMINHWRTLTFACTSFPKDMSNVQSNSFTTLSRTEWDIWDYLAQNRAALHRLPTFGDYAIAHPEMIDFDPVLMTMSANIRYTTTNAYLIVKGSSVKKQPRSIQYPVITDLLINRPEYSGLAYSWGDAYINNCAAGTVGPGNPMIWRKVGTNHHLTMVSDQISNYPGI